MVGPLVLMLDLLVYYRTGTGIYCSDCSHLTVSTWLGDCTKIVIIGMIIFHTSNVNLFDAFKV